MKRPNAEEISRWLMDDTLVAQTLVNSTWSEIDCPTNWNTIRVSIATVEGKALFEGDIFFNEFGTKFICSVDEHTRIPKSYWSRYTLAPPKPKSILDSEEFYKIVHSGRIDPLKQFLRDHKDEI